MNNNKKEQKEAKKQAYIAEKLKAKNAFDTAVSAVISNPNLSNNEIDTIIVNAMEYTITGNFKNEVNIIIVKVHYGLLNCIASVEALATMPYKILIKLYDRLHKKIKLEAKSLTKQRIQTHRLFNLTDKEQQNLKLIYENNLKNVYLPTQTVTTSNIEIAKKFCEDTERINFAAEYLNLSKTNIDKIYTILINNLTKLYSIIVDYIFRKEAVEKKQNREKWETESIYRYIEIQRYELKKSDLQKQEIKMPEPIPVTNKKIKVVKHTQKNVNKKLELFYEKGNKNKVPTYIADDFILTFFYFYLFKKYKNKCIIYDDDFKNPFKSLNTIGLTIDFKSDIQKNMLRVAVNIINCIKKTNENIIIIPLLLYFSRSAHANLLIYRKNLNQIEHFEPHGKYYSQDKIKLDLQIQNALKIFVNELNNLLIKNNLPSVTLIPAVDICPKINGLQNIESVINGSSIEGGGYCAAWSMFFAELCLKNPQIPSSELLTIIFDKLNSMTNEEQSQYLKKIIRGYVRIIDEKINKYFSQWHKTTVNINTILKNTNKIPLNFNMLKTLQIEEQINFENLKIEDMLNEVNNKIDELNSKSNIKKSQNELNDLVDLIYLKKQLEYHMFYEENMSPKSSSNSKSISPLTTKITRTKRCPNGTRRNKKTNLCEEYKK